MLLGHQLVSARELVKRRVDILEYGWNLDSLRGRFVEISGASSTAALTASAKIIFQAQQRKALAAWIGMRSTTFFPPDLAASGIDMSSLPVVHVPNVQRACWTADILLRSGSFALIVMDIDNLRTLSFSVQTRFIGLTQEHSTALLVITRKRHKGTASGSLVSLRGISEKYRVDHNRFVWQVFADKDKHATTGWNYKEQCCGPHGLC